MDRNGLLPHIGDAISSLAANCGYNLRRIIDAIRRIYAFIILMLTTNIRPLRNSRILQFCVSG